jgi:uncharacterized membrane protein YGL010W
MARTISQWLDEYGISHQHPTNKIVHWICVPSIMFSLMGLLYTIPFPLQKTWYFNWAAIALVFAWLFYLRLSVTIFLGFIPIGFAILLGLSAIAGSGLPVWLVCLVIFAIAWIGQFWGHKIEGKKPSFLEDLQFLLIGPAWLLHFIYRKLGIPI